MTISFSENLMNTTYKDDFSDSDGFKRILFNPRRALQARELTQSQTIIQKDIERFGRNIFKEGAMVNPGGISINANIEFVKDGSIQYYNKDQMSFLGIDAVAGTWEFSDDKMQVSYSYDVLTLNTIKLETIKKLKINSLGLENANGDKIYYEYY